MTPAELWIAVVACDACVEAAPALCTDHEKLTSAMEARAAAAFDTLKLLEGRRARSLPERRAAPPTKCSGCGEFLSAVRVQMRIDRCSNCESRPRKRRR